PLDHLYILITKKYRKVVDLQDIKSVGGMYFLKKNYHKCPLIHNKKKQENSNKFNALFLP
ncbi:MAG: hypothetical protein ACP5T1_07180, partial [Thermoplasmata archaeon]